MISEETLAIPPIRYRRRFRVRPCGTGAAYRRHFRRKGSELPVDPACAAWHRDDIRKRAASKKERACDT